MDALPEANVSVEDTLEVVSDEEDNIDPRIQTELDQLNFASTEINRLENELDEARTKYRTIIKGVSSEMEAIAHDRKKSIRKAREYFKLLSDTKLAQGELLKAARQFQTAVGVYKVAKETLALAESRLCEESKSAAAKLSSACQEALNHGLSKVMEAEKEKAQSEENHKKRASKFGELEARKLVLEKKYSRSIKKARPYFALKEELDVKLMQQKQNVTDLQAAIKCNKVKYTASLRKLESISEEIHQIRREKLWAKIPRMPGVGADTESLTSSPSDLDLMSMASGLSCSVDDSSDSDNEADDQEDTNDREAAFKHLTRQSSKTKTSAKPEGMESINEVIESDLNLGKNEESKHNSSDTITINNKTSIANESEVCDIQENEVSLTEPNKDAVREECRNVEIDNVRQSRIDKTVCGNTVELKQTCDKKQEETTSDKTKTRNASEVNADSDTVTDYAGVDMKTIERPLPSGEE